MSAAISQILPCLRIIERDQEDIVRMEGLFRLLMSKGLHHVLSTFGFISHPPLGPGARNTLVISSVHHLETMLCHIVRTAASKEKGQPLVITALKPGPPGDEVILIRGRVRLCALFLECALSSLSPILFHCLSGESRSHDGSVRL